MSFDLTLPSFLHFCSDCLEGLYGPFVQSLGIVFFVLLFNFAVRALLSKLRKRFSKQHRIWALSFVTALHKPLAYFVWFVAVICSLDTIVSSLFAYHYTNIHLVLSVGAILSCAWFLLRWNSEIVKHMMDLSHSNKIHFTPDMLDLFSKLATISILFITVFLLLDLTGRNMQTLIAFGGIGGLALAFASQQVISNFFAGLMIYLTRPFTIGEWINIPDKNIEGHIEEIGWYLTCIRNFEKRPIYVPNSVFSQSIVITPSRMTHERFHPTIGLRYRDIQVVKPIVDKIKYMLLHHSKIDHHLSIDVFFMNFGPSSLDIEVSAYLSSLAENRFKEIKQELLFQIAAIVAEEGGELATPTNIVEIHGGMTMKNPEMAPAAN